jgi:hypothetical protein
MKVGDPLPPLALKNAFGQEVRSYELLAKGPLVLRMFSRELVTLLCRRAVALHSTMAFFVRSVDRLADGLTKDRRKRSGTRGSRRPSP